MHPIMIQKTSPAVETGGAIYLINISHQIAPGPKLVEYLHEDDE